MSKKRFFITATDTDAGKTFIACALLRAAKKRKLTTAAIKPIAAGCELIDGELRNNDALLLQQTISEPLIYEQINPVALAEAIAPHLAAKNTECRVSVDRLNGFCQAVFMQGADFTVVEGAGGWRVPVNERETLADLARILNIPVILVVKMQLGCINHALLTVEAILRDNIQLAGWVANQTDKMDYADENIASLKRLIPVPCLAEIPCCSDIHADVLFDDNLFVD